MEQHKVEKSRPKKYFVLSIIFVLIIIILIPLILVFKSESNKDKVTWQDISPVLQLNVTHTLITGAWNEIVIAGIDTDKNDGMIEIYKYNEISHEWNMKSNITTAGGIIQSMAVSLYGTRLVICIMNPIRFIVYENVNGIWTKYGETIFPNNLVQNATSIDEALVSTPSVMLSNDGRILAISIQTVPNGDSTVHVLTDVNSLGGTIGGVWQRYGTIIQNVHEQDHGTFGTYTAMDGTGQKIVITSERETMSVYVWSDIDKSWNLQAEYDESPLSNSGSLAISNDGSTIAIGSYKGIIDGSGELNIINEVWPWFIYNNDHPWLIDGVDGPAYDPLSTTVNVAVSGTGDRVLVGRQSHSTNEVSLQVYQFDAAKTEWVHHGLPFGYNHLITYNKISLDMSNDGNMVAATVMGKVFIYKLIY
jgi:hypothetical protein